MSYISQVLPLKQPLLLHFQVQECLKKAQSSEIICLHWEQCGMSHLLCLTVVLSAAGLHTLCTFPHFPKDGPLLGGSGEGSFLAPARLCRRCWANWAVQTLPCGSSMPSTPSHSPPPRAVWASPTPLGHRTRSVGCGICPPFLEGCLITMPLPPHVNPIGPPGSLCSGKGWSV